MTGNRSRLVLMALPIAIALLAGVPAHADDTNAWGLAGTLGPSRIDMTLVVTNGHLGAGSHYFYQKHLKDIPLTGTIADAVTLQEPGGGTFTLHYKGREKTAPTDLENSTSLSGEWSGGGKTYPVTLQVGSVGSVMPGHRYRDVTTETDAQFEARVQGFYNNAIAGDHAATARYVSFPLRVNTGPDKYFLVRTPAQLSGEWKRVFPAPWIAALANELPHDMGTIKGQVVLGAGLAFFGAKGLEVVNLGD